MKKTTIVCLMLAASAQAASVKMAHHVGQRDPLQDYWEREAWASSRYCGNIEYSAKDMDDLSEKIQKLLGTAGAKLVNVNTFKPETSQIPQRQRARRSFNFKMPAGRVEEIAKKLNALAPVDSYNLNPEPRGQMNPAQEIKERIAALEAEMDQNKEALKNMPIARALYASKLDRLKRAQENVAGSDEVQFGVSVTQADR